MKLHEHTAQGLFGVTRLAEDAVEINGERFDAPLILTATELTHPWVTQPETVDEASLEPLWRAGTRVVLVGGPNDRAWPSERRRWLQRTAETRGAGVEFMEFTAACRTFNVLAREDRAVAALLFPANNKPIDSSDPAVSIPSGAVPQ